jgi:hypothetical protein
MRWKTAAIGASTDAVWATLADFGGLARWAPMIDHSRLVTEGAIGVGSVRRVQVGRQAVLEEIVDWQPATALTYRITGLPPIIRRATTTWELMPGADGCRIRVGSAVEGPPAISQLVTRRLERTDSKLLQALSRAVQETAGVSP